MPQHDPVVRRIPVRLTTTARADVQQQQQQQIEAATADAASSSLPLLLVQYPLQPHDQPPAVRALRAKPHSRQLEMETHLNAKSSMYDATRGENYANALNAQARARQRNAGGGTARNMFPFGGSGAVEQQARAAAGLTTTSMSSQRVTGENVSQHPNYVAGYLVDGTLHLTVVDDVLQLRPNMKYLDAIDQAMRDPHQQSMLLGGAGGTRDGASTDESGTEQEADAPKKKALLKKQEATETAMLLKSREALQRRIDEEPWVDMAFCDESHAASHGLRASHMVK